MFCILGQTIMVLKKIGADLLDNKTNKGKNDSLVLFVEKLYSNLQTYHKNQLLICDHSEKINQCTSCNLKHKNTGERPYSCIRPSDKTEFMNEMHCELEYKDLKGRLCEYKKDERKVFDDLLKLSEIMRTYIKIEWNRAKESK